MKKAHRNVEARCPHLALRATCPRTRGQRLPSISIRFRNTAALREACEKPATAFKHENYPNDSKDLVNLTAQEFGNDGRLVKV
jgi:hypothetical protein